MSTDICGLAITETRQLRHARRIAEFVRKQPGMHSRSFVLRWVQPGLSGLMDGSLSTLAPIFAVVLATHRPLTAFYAGLATALGAGVSMAFSEGLSDAGTLLGPQTGKLLSNLRAAGYQPEQVDEVYLTHLHTDHIGGLMAGDQRAFPNAIVRADIRDTDYWLSEENMRAAPAETERFFEASMASLSPYREAGKLNTFGGGADLIPGIQARPAYGHTPGHTMFEVQSKGEKLLLWGDIVHVAAVQFADPTVTIAYDVDPVEAEQEHWRVFDDAAKNRYMIGGAHLPFPGLGHVRNNGDNTYAFVPLN
jgi:glyoxylase-like metal-dependent hydrolase (beta-lactamase superfamily II)